jgi:hypothetical protein
LPAGGALPWNFGTPSQPVRAARMPASLTVWQDAKVAGVIPVPADIGGVYAAGALVANSVSW